MPRLKVTRSSGEVAEYDITPKIEWEFELHVNKSFYKTIVDDNKQSDVYWLAWACIRSSGEVVKPFGGEFLDTLAKVEVLGDIPFE